MDLVVLNQLGQRSFVPWPVPVPMTSSSLFFRDFYKSVEELFIKFVWGILERKTDTLDNKMVTQTFSNDRNG